MKDEEEEILYEKLRNIILELDNLCDISTLNADLQNEVVYTLALTEVQSGTQKQLIRLPKSKSEAVTNLKEKLKAEMGSDRTENLSALTELLKDELSNE